MKLYFKYIAIHIKSAMEYKMSFIMMTLAQFISSITVFLGMNFLLQRFTSIKGYTYDEVLICFSTILLSFSIAECFFRGFDTFSRIISNGEFDRMLVRPKNLVIQVLSSKVEFTKLGRIVFAIVVLCYILINSSINFTPDKIITIIFMIIGGVGIFSGLFMINAAICFYTIEGIEAMNILTDGGREFGKYPMSVYGDTILKIFTYIIPYALVQYYPFLYIIGRTDNKFYMFLPLIACLFIVPSYAIWKIGVRHYKSIGS